MGVRGYMCTGARMCACVSTYSNTYAKIHVGAYVCMYARSVELPHRLMLILVCHWLACVWALTLQLVSSDLPQWIDSCLFGCLGLRLRAPVTWFMRLGV